MSAAHAASARPVNVELRGDHERPGFQTVVTLFNVDLTTNPDPALFHIDENLPANQLGNRRR